MKLVNPILDFCEKNKRVLLFAHCCIACVPHFFDLRLLALNLNL